MTLKKDLELKVGRRESDGEILLSPLTPHALQLTVSYKGDRASSVVLTLLQVQSLRQALAEFEVHMETDDSKSEKWNNVERRGK
jgi:hypothetical protein